MTAQFDVFMLTISGLFNLQLNQNVFMYQITDTPSTGAPEGLVTEFLETVLPTIAAIQSTDFNWYNAKAVNLFDAADLYEENIDVDGTRSPGSSAADQPSFLALGVKLQRGNARVRNGYKYFGGLIEGDVSNGLWNVGGAPQTNLQAALSTTLVAGGIDTFQPVIVAREQETKNFINKFGQTVSYTAYSLPKTQAEMDDKFAPVIQASVNPQVTTMRSRKVGHGV